MLAIIIIIIIIIKYQILCLLLYYKFGASAPEKYYLNGTWTIGLFFFFNKFLFSLSPGLLYSNQPNPFLV